MSGLIEENVENGQQPEQKDENTKDNIIKFDSINIASCSELELDTNSNKMEFSSFANIENNL